MYGLVNEGIRDLVVSVAGPEAWAAICSDAGIPPEGFEPLCPYDDSLTYKLVGLVSQKLNLSAEEVLIKFGEEWITYTAENGYGELLKIFGTNFRGCLTNLNKMHAHMGSMMPSLAPPQFQVELTGETEMIVHYFSKRDGLAPMVVGLLQGLAKKFGENITLQHIPKGTRSDHDEFTVRIEQP